jgi:hypothetical protein
MNISTTNQTAATVGLDLLRALIDEMRLCPKPWAAMSQAQQDEVIERLRRPGARTGARGGQGHCRRWARGGGRRA